MSMVCRAHGVVPGFCLPVSQQFLLLTIWAYLKEGKLLKRILIALIVVVFVVVVVVVVVVVCCLLFVVCCLLFVGCWLLVVG